MVQLHDALIRSGALVKTGKASWSGHHERSPHHLVCGDLCPVWHPSASARNRPTSTILGTPKEKFRHSRPLALGPKNPNSAPPHDDLQTVVPLTPELRLATTSNQASIQHTPTALQHMPVLANEIWEEDPPSWTLSIAKAPAVDEEWSGWSGLAWCLVEATFRCIAHGLAMFSNDLRAFDIRHRQTLGIMTTRTSHGRTRIHAAARRER